MSKNGDVSENQNILDAGCLPVNRLAFSRILSPDW